MGRPPKPGEKKERTHPQGRVAGPFQKPLSLRLTLRGWETLVAERKALQELVDRGEISQAECSYSYILERALTLHAARTNTAEGKAADLAFLADLRKRWQSESPKPMPLASSMATTDIKALVRQELASALQSELPGILQAIADGAGKASKAPAKKPRK